MRVSRIVLLLVALLAGGLAAFLALGNAFDRAPPQAPAVQVAQVPHDQVLIAKANIGLGERLGPNNLAWQDWPQNTLQPEYITSSAMPDAIDKMKGSVARFELFKAVNFRFVVGERDSRATDNAANGASACNNA